MSSQVQDQLFHLIEQELHVEPEAIALAQRNVQFPFHLPISLWQYGLISLDGVSQIWTWIETLSEQASSPVGHCS